MFKALKEMKRKDDIQFEQFANQVNYQFKKIEEKNDGKMTELKNQRKLKAKTKQQLPLWAEAIKTGKF